MLDLHFKITLFVIFNKNVKIKIYNINKYLWINLTKINPLNFVFREFFFEIHALHGQYKIGKQRLLIYIILFENRYVFVLILKKSILKCN